jgi:hypothetical protein
VCVCVCVRSYRGMYRERTRVTYTYITHTIATITSAAVTTCMLTIISMRQHTSAYISIRQHTSAYVSTCQHTSAYVSIRHHLHADYYQSSKMCWFDLQNKNTRNLLPVAAAPFFSLRILVREKERSVYKQSKLKTNKTTQPNIRYTKQNKTNMKMASARPFLSSSPTSYTNTN